MAKNWYVVHTYSGYEQKIEKKIRLLMEGNEAFGNVCFDVKVPFETLDEVKDGKHREVKHKILPGYILVSLDLPDEDYQVFTGMIKRIEGVTGFVSGTSARGSKPAPLSKEEVENIFQKTGDIKVEKVYKPKESYEVGEQVRVVGGPFNGFSGSVEEVNPDRGNLKVSVEIFGRPTPVVVEYGQVEKI